ncbi:hypothetical protein FHG87_017081 [Trinorchestia longiramus]|nr:hypothetical protein FHG87_017081 [Trinorchestia longiramus]
MNMTKHDLRLLMLHEFKLGHNASEASANINRAWGEESTRDRTVRRWFWKFRSGDENLKDEEGRGRLGSLENEQLHAVVEQNLRQSVKEISQTLGISIATVSRHLKIIGMVKKLDKWVPHKLNENQKLKRFEVCSRMTPSPLQHHCTPDGHISCSRMTPSPLQHHCTPDGHISCSRISRHGPLVSISLPAAVVLCGCVMSRDAVDELAFKSPS